MLGCIEEYIYIVCVNVISFEVFLIMGRDFFICDYWR